MNSFTEPSQLQAGAHEYAVDKVAPNTINRGEPGSAQQVDLTGQRLIMVELLGERSNVRESASSTPQGFASWDSGKQAL
jgi:hypothetical protein